MKLTKGTNYDISELTCTGWTEGDGSGHEGYDWTSYFRDGAYLGADEDGIEPIFAEPETTTFHKSNFGRFGDNLPCDLDGYAHTTAEGWMNAPLDGMAWQGYDDEAKEDRCEEMAAEAREAVAAAKKALGEWQQEKALGEWQQENA